MIWRSVQIMIVIEKNQWTNEKCPIDWSSDEKLPEVKWPIADVWMFKVQIMMVIEKINEPTVWSV